MADLANDAMSPLFQACVEAVEEAVYNAMLQAVTTFGRDGHKVEALDPVALKEILEHHRLARDGRRIAQPHG